MAYVMEYKPLDPMLGLLHSQLVTRLTNFTAEMYPEADAELVTRQFLGRSLAGDAGLKILLAVTPEGQLVGHAVASIEQQGARRWVYVWQCKIDGKQDGVAEEMLRQFEAWGLEYTASELLMTTPRSERAWEKKHHFKTRHAVMGRPIPYVEDVTQ